LIESGVDRDAPAEPVAGVDLALAAVEGEQEKAPGNQDTGQFREHAARRASLEVNQRVEGDDPGQRGVGDRRCRA